MGLYDGIKDVAKIVQKADNIELYQKLLDLSAQALDMQNKIYILTEENNNLKKKQDVIKNIERHESTYITLKEDKDKIKYCSNCFDTKQQLVQVKEMKQDNMFICPSCKNRGYIFKE